MFERKSVVTRGIDAAIFYDIVHSIPNGVENVQKTIQREFIHFLHCVTMAMLFVSVRRAFLQ